MQTVQEIETIQEDTLKTKVKTDPCFHAVMQQWTKRERSRSQVTVAGLMLHMRKTGYNYPKSRYQEVIKFLADAGMGKLIKSRTGQVKSMDDVRYSLQSIGTSALGKPDFKPNKPGKLKPKTIPPTSIRRNNLPKQPKNTIDIVACIDNETYRFPILSNSITKDTLQKLLASIYIA